MSIVREIKSKFHVLFYYLVYYPFRNLKDTIVNWNEKRLIDNVPSKQLVALSNLKSKKQLNCIFFVVSFQGWKYDLIYKEMAKSERFNPVILICPVVNNGKDAMIRRLKENFDYFMDLKYNVICSYDINSGKYLDVKDLNPDIIFYTNPYEGLIDDKYFIKNFADYLTVYVPYAFNNNIDFKFCQDQLLHNLVWRYYSESNEHLSYSKRFSRCKGRNAVVTGYPGIDELIDGHIPSISDWKIKDKRLKRIIWAPHHTIEAVHKVNYSCFLQYSDFMLEIADRYKDRAQFVFKPHPLLRDKLELLWGPKKTADYYDQWKNRPNCDLNDGAYVDLFLTSDAMIHDSGSFLIEYLYTNKPVMRTLNDIPLNEMYNSFALKCLDHYYFANNKNDIDTFIQNVIIGNDPLKESRTKFVNEELMPKGSPSQNIINDILDSIDNQIVYRN